MGTSNRQHPAPGTKKVVSGPVTSLDEVVPLVRLALIGKTRAARMVQARLGLSEPKAEHYIRQGLKALKSTNYVETVEMDWDPVVVADVYGLTDTNGGWFIKFYVEHGRLQVASFHGPEYDLHCCDGSIVKKES